MNSRTGCIRAVLALAAAAAVATPAFAQNGLCIQDAYNSFNGTNKNLSCTANDVSLASVVPGSVQVISGGLAGNTDACLAGGQFNFVATFNVKTTSSSARSNIGIFFANSVSSSPKTGSSCSDAILSYTHPCPGAPSLTCGSTQYEELDGPINGETGPPANPTGHGCGDTSSADGGGTGIQQSVIEVDGVTCPQTAAACPAGLGFPAGSTCMALPYCTSWYQPANGMPTCDSPTWAWKPTAVPGTSSKCDCSIVYVPIQPITPSVTVNKRCTLNSTDSTSCALGAEGGTATYKVNITNSTPAGEGGVILDQVCDDQYGTIYRNPSVPSATSGGPPACATGAQTGVSASNFACTGTTLVSGQYDIANGASAACTWTVPHGENLSVTDQATVYTQSDTAANTPSTPKTTNTVTVTSTDAGTTAKTNLGLEPGPQAACVTVRFDVTVQNTSFTDETVTLNSSGTVAGGNYVPALLDKTFGDITSTHGTAALGGSVVGTTCGAPTAAGLGTLSTSAGAGTFPKILTFGTTPVTPATNPPSTSDGGSYSCMFDGVICATPTSTAVPNCAEGITAQAQVTPNLTGDDVSPAPADVITVTANAFNANICLIQSGVQVTP